MNKRLVLHSVGLIMLIEALAMAPSCVIALAYRDGDVWALGKTMLLLCALGLPAWRLSRPRNKNLRAREGFTVVALSWVMLSVFGALPFVFSGLLPRFTDALFEAVSGFSTTGATVLTHFENLPHGVIFGRSFTHWIGGMGVLVLTLAILPQMSGCTSHLVRAESPGPTLSKLVPKMGDTAKILYLIYTVLTVLEWVALMIAGMNPYDAAIHALGTAGTGGFSNYALSVGAFNSVAIEIVTTVFMALFGVNLALVYRALMGGWRDALRSEELHWYLGILFGAMMLVSLAITPQYGGFFKALRYGSFQVASIISTTGYGTADYTLWAPVAQMVLLILMFTGSCAGSTAGGMKLVRVALLCKTGRREVRRTFQPRKVEVVRFEGHGTDESVLSQVAVFFFVYIALVLVGGLVLSLEGHYDLLTNLTESLTCVSNVGPGFGAVGPMGSFASYGPFAKVVMSILMLCGRLELFPILVLFHPALWRRS